MKKCPQCNSISSDTESSCGVCGGSLSEAPSQSLESLVHKAPQVRPVRKMNKAARALIILALAMSGGGTALFVLRNVLGLVLLFAGLVLTLLIVGGPAEGWGGGQRGSGPAGSREMRRAQIEEEEKERRRRRGEED